MPSTVTAGYVSLRATATATATATTDSGGDSATGSGGDSVKQTIVRVSAVR